MLGRIESANHTLRVHKSSQLHLHPRTQPQHTCIQLNMHARTHAHTHHGTQLFTEHTRTRHTHTNTHTLANALCTRGVPDQQPHPNTHPFATPAPLLVLNTKGTRFRQCQVQLEGNACVRATDLAGAVVLSVPRLTRPVCKERAQRLSD